MGELARQALDEIKAAFVERSHADGHRFSAAALHLSGLRDMLAAAQRRDGATPESRQRLERVNAVISIVLACHFPLDTLPWNELEKARDWLAEIVHQPGGTA